MARVFTNISNITNCLMLRIRVGYKLNISPPFVLWLIGISSYISNWVNYFKTLIRIADLLSVKKSICLLSMTETRWTVGQCTTTETQLRVSWRFGVLKVYFWVLCASIDAKNITCGLMDSVYEQDVGNYIIISQL